MAYDEEVYEKLMANFTLLCNIIRQNNGNQLKVDLSKIEEIINKKIPDTLKKNAPEDFYELYTDFKSEYEKFRDFILYDKLIGKKYSRSWRRVFQRKVQLFKCTDGKNQSSRQTLIHQPQFRPIL